MFNKNKLNHIALIFVLVFICCSCAHKSGHNRRERDRLSVISVSDEKGYTSERKIKGHTKVEMRKENGVLLVPITVNGLNLDFIFDTGASSICISSLEAMVMLRQGQITENDIVGQQQFQDATGKVSVGTTIILRSVQIGGIELTNVEATVVDNIQAPLLLGQTALAKFGKVTIDYNSNTIEFN
mgnify:CR=1 FL=1